MVRRTENQYGDSLNRQRKSNTGLIEAEVRHIRKLLVEGMSPREIAQAYNVGLETIRRIDRRDTWAWLDQEVTPKLPSTSPEADQAAQDSLTRLLALGVPITKEAKQDIPIVGTFFTIEPEKTRGEGLLDKILQEAGNDKAERDKPETELDKLVGK